MPDDRYDRVTFHDKLVDRVTMELLKVAERRLGYELTITQGSFSTAVSASAGTHSRGGVVDLAPFDAENKLRVLKDLGMWIWYRSSSDGPWAPHIHGGILGHKNLAPAAARQELSYLAGRNGLASNRVDSSYRPNPIRVFDYPAAIAPNRVQRAHQLLADAAEAITGASLLLAAVPPPRPKVKGEIPRLRDVQILLSKSRARLPKE